MRDLKNVVANRVGKHHRVCGYCFHRLTSASSLRRHIREKPKHEIYQRFLELLHIHLEPISQTHISDPWSPLEYDALKRKAPEETESVEIPNVSSVPAPEHCADTVTLLEMIGHLRLPLLAEALQGASLSSLDSCSSAVRDTWTRVGGLPVAFASSKMYFGERRHRDKDIFVQYLSSARVRLFVNGVEDPQMCHASRRQMMYELAHEYRAELPSDSRISAAFCLKDDNILFIPRLETDSLAQGQEQTEVILTSRGGLTDLHIDNGKCVVSSPVEHSRRLFFLWPPTKHNLAVLEKWGSRGDRLLNCCHDLQSGVYQVLGGEDALRMRPGVIHAVLTLQGGFVVTKAYIDEATLGPMSSWLSNSPSLVEGRSDTEMEVLAQNWVDAAELAIVDHLFASWQALPPRLKHTMRTRIHLRKQIEGLWYGAITKCPPKRRQINGVLQDFQDPSPSSAPHSRLRLPRQP